MMSQQQQAADGTGTGDGASAITKPSTSHIPPSLATALANLMVSTNTSTFCLLQPAARYNFLYQTAGTQLVTPYDFGPGIWHVAQSWDGEGFVTF
jgi:hypothetical protein